MVEAALFDADALAAVTDLAVDTDDALATMRAALDRYEQGYAASAAAATPPLEDTDPDAYLDGVIRQIGRLEGYLVERAGHRAEADGRDGIGRSSVGSTSDRASSAPASPGCSRCRCSTTASTRAADDLKRALGDARGRRRAGVRGVRRRGDPAPDVPLVPRALRRRRDHA